ncbi:STAS domain-containing protein [Mycolicibacterium pyrenivorans]|uniref:STAS domain-containing protein n=1 Tax=Mycolicibacterium pyrenivorans TaxID=187102 RepID=UPI0021F27B64|nr:STAS domain-containing protein [Mycolicibacterium pyrenivorans]MCV7150402.1 STAS domain-containing protein [Mycolicibacterium pyrenivorans]
MSRSGHDRRGRFTVSPQRDDATLVLHVAGDLDVLTAPTLGTHLDVALSSAIPTSVVIVDLTDVEFLSSVGISVLVETHRLTACTDLSLRVVAEGPVTSRPLRLMRLDEVIDLYPTVEAARQGRDD